MPNLLLIPTSFERNIVRSMPEPKTAWMRQWQTELCGFGLAASGTMAASLIARVKPSRVMLIGIAGCYGASVEIGSAIRIQRVGCHGIGVGNPFAAAYRSAQTMGWSPIEAGEHGPAIGDEITLGSHSGAMILSVATASANADEADHRRGRYADAVAEDMESFSVAIACQIAGIPLEIVRGISNTAGDRDHRCWRATDAMMAAVDLAASLTH